MPTPGIITIEKVRRNKTPLYNIKKNDDALSFLESQNSSVRRMNVFALKVVFSFNLFPCNRFLSEV